MLEIYVKRSRSPQGSQQEEEVNKSM